MDLEEKERLFWEPSSSRLVIFREAKKDLSVVHLLEIPFPPFYFFSEGEKRVYLSQNQVQKYLVQNQVWLCNAHTDGTRDVIITDEHFGTLSMLPALPPIRAATVPGQLQSHIWSLAKIILSVLLFTGHCRASLLTETLFYFRWHHSPPEDDVIISPLNTEVKEER